MSDTLVLIFEIIGTVSFSISGALTGLKKQMDIFGIVILGLVTAVGGGIIRDLILGITPPNTFLNPIYALVAVITALIVFIPAVRHFFYKKQIVFEHINLWMDSVGLGIFTVVGIRTAHETVEGNNIFLFIFVGILTGVGGGVLRDIMAGQTPYIFIKHFYACASLIGAVVCVTLWKPIGEITSMFIGAAVVTVLRLLAAHYRWNLPKPID